jgi:hypothetical protein
VNQLLRPNGNLLKIKHHHKGVNHEYKFRELQT